MVFYLSRENDGRRVGYGFGGTRTFAVTKHLVRTGRARVRIRFPIIGANRSENRGTDIAANGLFIHLAAFAGTLSVALDADVLASGEALVGVSFTVGAANWIVNLNADATSTGLGTRAGTSTLPFSTSAFGLALIGVGSAIASAHRIVALVAQALWRLLLLWLGPARTSAITFDGHAIRKATYVTNVGVSSAVGAANGFVGEAIAVPAWTLQVVVIIVFTGASTQTSQFHGNDSAT